MGLDIYFNLKTAVDAGLKVTMEPNGDASKTDSDDYEYVAWLNQVNPVVEIPVVNYKVVAHASGDEICIRANKWGSTYLPLTQWLKHHSIEWTEN